MRLIKEGMIKNNKQNGFPSPYKISKSFKIFLVFFLIIGLAFVGYLLFKAGESLQNVIELIIAAVFGIALILWTMTNVKKIRYSENLSDAERLYIEDLGRCKITEVIKKYVFSNMDISEPLRFIIVMGGIIKWTLFWIFCGGIILLLLHTHTSFDITLLVSLIVIWCPWTESLILEKINFKMAFLLKLILTILIGAVGIIVTGQK